MHTDNEKLGEVWLRVVIEKKNNLSMQMWAPNRSTYKKSLEGVEKLKELLSDAGLNVSSFEIFNDKKPGKEEPEKKKNLLGENIFSGSTIDVEA